MEEGHTTLVHMLPPEILCDIFSLNVLNTQKTRSFKPLITMCSVCRYWRDIACSTPAFWSEFSIVTSTLRPSLESDSERPDLEWLQIWLTRSAEHPLNFCFNATGKSEYAVEVFRLLHTYIHRWEVVHYIYSSGRPNWIPNLPPKASASRLEAVTVDSGAMFTPVDDLGRWLISLSTTSPRLKEFSSPDIHPNLPWNQLTRLKLNYQADLLHSGCYDILSKSPLLEMAEFFVCMMNSMTHSNVLPELVHNIQSFTIHTFFDLGPLFDSLVLPHLRELSIMQVYTGWIQSFFPYGPLLGLLSRSGCTLRSLSFRKIEIREEGFLRCLEHDSVRGTLRELHLTDCMHPIGDAILRFLTIATARTDVGSGLMQQQHCALPRLEVLELRSRVVATDGVLSDMVFSRLKSSGDGCCGLKRLAVRLRGLALHRWDIERLRAMMQELEVDVELESSEHHEEMIWL